MRHPLPANGFIFYKFLVEFFSKNLLGVRGQSPRLELHFIQVKSISCIHLSVLERSMLDRKTARREEQACE